jgi:hypothetical protein
LNRLGNAGVAAGVVSLIMGAGFTASYLAGGRQAPGQPADRVEAPAAVVTPSPVRQAGAHRPVIVAPEPSQGAGLLAAQAGGQPAAASAAPATATPAPPPAPSPSPSPSPPGAPSRASCPIQVLIIEVCTPGGTNGA